MVLSLSLVEPADADCQGADGQSDWPGRKRRISVGTRSAGRIVDPQPALQRNVLAWKHAHRLLQTQLDKRKPAAARGLKSSRATSGAGLQVPGSCNRAAQADIRDRTRTRSGGLGNRFAQVPRHRERFLRASSSPAEPVQSGTPGQPPTSAGHDFAAHAVALARYSAGYQVQRRTARSRRLVAQARQGHESPRRGHPGHRRPPARSLALIGVLRWRSPAAHRASFAGRSPCPPPGTLRPAPPSRRAARGATPSPAAGIADVLSVFFGCITVLALAGQTKRHVPPRNDSPRHCLRARY